VKSSKESRPTSPDVIDRREAKAQGLQLYFTGERCWQGHLSERYVSNGKCVLCSKLNIPPKGLRMRIKMLRRDDLFTKPNLSHLARRTYRPRRRKRSP
jgi:hypothetical protein